MRYAEVHVPVPVAGPFTYIVPSEMAVQPGCRVRVEFGRQKLTGYVAALSSEYSGEYSLKPLLECLDDEPVFDDELVQLAQLVAAHYLCTIGEVLQAAIPSARSSAVRGVKAMAPPVDAPVLSDAQRKIFADIRNAVTQGRLHHLLHGITGSGKTEIYISLALDCLARGQSVLYLVPEISLTPQIFSRLQAVFGGTLLIYHSGLSPNRRLAAWLQFAGAEPRVSVGTRSAVFARCDRLG
jgi:primosomal protein N' (replication factor Y)